MEYTDYRKVKEEKSRQLMKDFGNLVNGGADSEALQEEFCSEHRTLQQSIVREMVGIIIMMSKDEFHTDGRNEGSKALAKKFVEGYAEMTKREEKERMLKEGCGEEYSERKAEEYRVSIVKNPEKYIGLGFI